MAHLADSSRRRLHALLGLASRLGWDRPRPAHRLCIDAVAAVGDGAFYVQGWMRDDASAIIALVAISPSGRRADLTASTFRHRRPDVETYFSLPVDERRQDGMIAYFELDEPTPHGRWTFETRTAAGRVTRVRGPAVIEDLHRVREMIFADLTTRMPAHGGLLLDLAARALGRLEDHRHRVNPSALDTVEQHGSPPVDPPVSIIIPLYRRLDFMEHQLAQFVHDPEFAHLDVIYMLDSPELARDVRTYAAQLFRLYRVPFRVGYLAQNVGFATVNNLAAQFARGPLLVLLNSDVLPERPGWVGRLAAFHRATPKIGALAPKLLFEDDSLQHAGLYFVPVDETGDWDNATYFKGLHRDLPAANRARPVPAVTAACMMIDRGLYLRLGGFRPCYLQGDYEDSDLCLRLLEAGYKNWYQPDVELYHLEGQSYDGELRELVRRCNRRLHSRLWRDHIPTVMARYQAR